MGIQQLFRDCQCKDSMSVCSFFCLPCCPRLETRPVLVAKGKKVVNKMSADAGPRPHESNSEPGPAAWAALWDECQQPPLEKQIPIFFKPLQESGKG